MAIVGPNYKFICARIGGYGTNSNWGGGANMWWEVNLKEQSYKPLSGGEIITTYCAVSDALWKMPSDNWPTSGIPSTCDLHNYFAAKPYNSKQATINTWNLQNQFWVLWLKWKLKEEEDVTWLSMLGKNLQTFKIKCNQQIIEW